MDINISSTQKKRVEKIERLRRYFREESPHIYSWTPASDETLDFTSMSDSDVEEYLKRVD